LSPIRFEDDLVTMHVLDMVDVAESPKSVF